MFIISSHSDEECMKDLRIELFAKKSKGRMRASRIFRVAVGEVAFSAARTSK